MTALIPEDVISEVQRSADIVDIISESVALRKAGRDHLGLCPFHTEKTPSFTVSSQKQMFHCFGCGVGGSVFSYVMRRQGISFPEAVRQLADRYGIRIPEAPLNEQQRRARKLREDLFEINRIAADFYRKVLVETTAGKAGRSYLSQRQIGEDILSRFQLGFAPDRWDALLIRLQKKGWSPQIVEKSGLAVARKSGSGWYDRFRKRVMFPIWDAQGRPIGFGGRVVDDAMPKYMNSPETPVYSKSHSLYGLHLARPHCLEKGVVYIVEGYLDLLALAQHGIENVVATLGTALTKQHVSRLRGCVGSEGRMVLVYDSDEAGIKAAQRSIDIFRQGFADARIMILPGGYDPDSYVFEKGPEAFLSAADNAMGMTSFLIETAVRRHGLSLAGKYRIVEDLKAHISASRDPVARALYVRELAERVGISEDAIAEKMRKGGPLRPTGVTAGDEKPEKKAKNRIGGSRIERQVLAMLIQSPRMVAEMDLRNLFAAFSDPQLASLARQVRSYFQNQPDAPVAGLVDDIEDENAKELVTAMAMTDAKWDMDGCRLLLSQFENYHARHHNQLLDRIRSAEKSNDTELLLQLLKDKQAQAKERRSTL